MDENSNNKKSFSQTIKGAVSGFISHWSTPKEGNEVPNKEILTFSVGSMGLKTLTGMSNYIQLASTCVLTGTIYRLSPINIMILFIISTIIGVAKVPIMSMIVDNTNTKWGKFRPYSIFAGIPAFIGVFGLCFFVPIDGSNVVKMVLIGIFYNIYAIAQGLLLAEYAGISQVISSSTNERNKILAISEFLANLGPSILQLAFPVFAALFFGDETGLTDIRSYRLLFPIFAGLSLGMMMLILFFTKERAIIPKGTKENIKFMQGLKIISKNADFWIVSTSRFFLGFKNALTLLLPWVCIYIIKSSSAQGLIQTAVSVAFTPGMILAPFLMKKLGNNKSAFIAFGANALAAAFMLATFKIHWAFFAVGLFLFNFAMGPQFIMQKSITADALDEIQLQTGERIEGFAENFQMMFETLGGVLSQLCFTAIYAKYGLGEDYTVLYNPDVLQPIIAWTIGLAIVASILCAIPFLFSKMTPEKHEAIIKELQARKAAQEGTLEETPSEDSIPNAHQEIPAQE